MYSRNASSKENFLNISWLQSRWMLPLVLLLALGLRLLNIDATSLWIDEIYSFSVANGHLPDTMLEPAVHSARFFYERYLAWQPLDFAILLESLKINVHMPLYYLLLNPWLGMFGNTEAVLRGFSALFSGLTIVPVHFLGSAMLGRRAGVLAAIVMALAPYQLYYAQEGRMYTLSLFWAVLSALSFWKVLYGDKPLPWSLLYAVSITLGVLSHYMFLFFLLTHAIYGVVWLAKHWDVRRFALFGFGVAALLVLAIWWMPIYTIQKQGVDEAYHFAKGLVGWSRYLTVFVWQPLVVIAGDNRLERIFYLPFTVMVFLWPWLQGYLQKRQLSSDLASPNSGIALRNEGFLLFWIFGLLVVQVIYDLFKQTHTVVVDRYILLISPAMILWLGLSLSRLANTRFRRIVPILLGVMLVLAFANVWSPSAFRDEHNKKDIRGKLAYFVENARPDDLIFVNGPWGAPSLAAWYLNQSRPDQPMVYWISSHNGQTVPFPKDETFRTYSRVWLFRNRANNERGLQVAKEELRRMYPHLQEVEDWFVYSR